ERRGGGDRTNFAAGSETVSYLRTSWSTGLIVRGVVSRHCAYRRIAASVDAHSICLFGRIGCGWRGAACAATHPQSSRTYEDRHHGLQKPARFSRAWNFAAIARRRTRSNSQAKQTKGFVTVTAPIVLPWPLRSGLEAATWALFDLGDQSCAEFSRPPGEASLVSPQSVSWRVVQYPLSLFIGGVAAVIMELAEPRVRTGVWEHTTFRIDPIQRLRRTGLAAMVTIYGAHSTAEAMIARVRRMHDRVAGSTPTGKAYRA